MNITMTCPRCASGLQIISRPTQDAPGIYRVVPHTCYRFLVAECWEKGEVIACWTSDTPGKTGPQDLARSHSIAADRGWIPPAGDGWTYRWDITKGDTA